MIIQGNEDLRIQKTIIAIKDIFSNMLLAMDYNKITVKELCDKAKINKKTFYKYYENLDFLLAELLDEFSNDFLNRIKDYTVPDDLEKINREFFKYSTEQGELYEKIICNAADRHIGSKMIDKIVKATWNKSSDFNELDKYKKKILLAFIYNVGIEIYRQWISDNKKISLEEIIDISNKLLCRGIFGFFDIKS